MIFPSLADSLFDASADATRLPAAFLIPPRQAEGYIVNIFSPCLSSESFPSPWFPDEGLIWALNSLHIFPSALPLIPAHNAARVYAPTPHAPPTEE